MVTKRSKVKLTTHHDVAHLQPLINFPTNYQLPTLYGLEILPLQNFKGQGHYNVQVKDQIIVTP